jgi:hypothetical protein
VGHAICVTEALSLAAVDFTPGIFTTGIALLALGVTDAAVLFVAVHVPRLAPGGLAGVLGIIIAFKRRNIFSALTLGPDQTYKSESGKPPSHLGISFGG